MTIAGCSEMPVPLESQLAVSTVRILKDYRTEAKFGPVQPALVDNYRASLCPQTSLGLHSVERCLGRGQLRLASRQLRRQKRELRIQMASQLLDGSLKPVIGGNLLRLAPLHSLEVGHHNVGKDLGKSGKRIVHEEILSKNRAFRMITTGRVSVIPDPGNRELKQNNGGFVKVVP